MQDKSGNPALSRKAIDLLGTKADAGTATIGGTTVKTFILLMLAVLGGYFGWQAMASSSIGIMMLVATFVALGLAIVTIFKPNVAMITGPLYALAMGYVLGAISQMYNVQFDGIVLQAIGLTGALFFVSLWAFSLGLIKVTNKFRTGVIIATLGIAVYYLVALLMSLFFGATVPLIYDSGPWGIAFSVVIIFIATLNLILDFDVIQKMVKGGAPKKLEWYGAFTLMVTLVWLYLEVLRLLGKVRG